MRNFVHEFVVVCRNAAPSFVAATMVVFVDNVIDVASSWSSFLIVTGIILVVTCVDTMIRKGVR